MKIYDISRTLNRQIGVWPGDTPYSLSSILSRQDGASVNLTTIQISAHCGTHIDAPRHFTDGGATMEAVDLTPFWGTAQLVSLEAKAGAIGTDAFAGIDLSVAPRLLIHTFCSHLDQAKFPREIPYPSPELAALLADNGIVLFGTDAPSVDHVQDADLPGHNSLLAGGIAILEGLDFNGVPDGVYELSALPLKIEGGDGSPTRAVLRSLAD